MVVVTNSKGTVTSTEATLTVTANPVPPSISAHPAALTVTKGKPATFTVEATGTSPLRYQWQKSGVDIAGATSSMYTIAATEVADSGAYSVVVSNSAGSPVTSNSAALTVSARYSLVPKTGGTYTKEECVKDLSTGLVWEGKTASPATTRLGTSTYTNFDSTASAQKSGGVNPTQAEIDAPTNSIGYKNSVNTSALCGYTDWRLPTKEELQGILASSGSPIIDTTWFPNTQANLYWTSSPFVGLSYSAWDVHFGDGYVGNHGYRYDGYHYHVRLVR